MKTKALIIITGVILMSSMCGQVWAQKDTIGATYTENVVVVGSYDPRLMDFPKKEFSPTIVTEEIKKTNMKYSIFSQPMKIAYQTSPIKAAKMTGEPFTELYGNYLRVGFGTGRTPYGELFLNTKRNKTKSLGLHIKHFSSNAKIPDYAYSGFSNNEVDLSGSNIKPKYTLYGKLFLDRDVIHYYGFKPAEILDTLEKDEIKQRYNDVGGMFSWYSTHADSSHLNHQMNLNYHCFWNISNATENSVSFSGFLNKKVNWLHKVSKNQVVGLRYDVEHYFNNRGFKSFNAGVVEIAPYISTNFGSVYLEVSPKLNMKTDSISQACFFPYIRLELNLLPGTLSAFGGLDGDLKYNSFRTLANENPFIHHFVTSDYSKTIQRLYGGIRGNIARSFSYTVQAINRKIENCALFVNDSLTYMGNWMGVVYDEKVNWFRAEFNSELKIKNKWKGLLMMAYNQAESVSEAEVWNIPNFEGMIGVSYNLADEIMLNARVFYIGKRYAKPTQNDLMMSYALKSILLDPCIDANLTLEYRYSKVLSAFLEFSNIASQRYMIWNQYPSYRFRFLGGVTYSF